MSGYAGAWARRPDAGTGRFLACLAVRFRRGAALVALLGALAMPGQVMAAAEPETFGPAKVTCESLGPGQFDCLLTSLRVSPGGNNVATFSLAIVPPTERANFQKWCLVASDHCTVLVRGDRLTPGGSRLSAMTSVRWTRRNPPRNNAAANALAN